MTLIHHVLVRYAAWKVGEILNQYIILGDDIVIANSKVAQSYLDLMTKIGVDISMQKRIIPKNGISSAEFASKLVRNGIDVSPYPLGLLVEGGLVRIFTFVHELMKARIQRDLHHGDCLNKDNVRHISHPDPLTVVSGSVT